jgi:hypothetical protein
MRRLWRRILCLLRRHGFDGLAHIDTLDYRSAHMTANGFGGTFVEKMNPRFHRTWYRVWLAACPYCRKLSPVTERDVPIEMRSM